jgi:hypothetical protein
VDLFCVTVCNLGLNVEVALTRSLLLGDAPGRVVDFGGLAGVPKVARSRRNSLRTRRGEWRRFETTFPRQPEILGQGRNAHGVQGRPRFWPPSRANRTGLDAPTTIALLAAGAVLEFLAGEYPLTDFCVRRRT